MSANAGAANVPGDDVQSSPSLVVLISCYELGRQPLSLAWPLAYLRRAGLSVIAIDCSIDPVPDAVLRQARLIALATPMHTALRVAAPLFERARQVNPAAIRCAFGLYAGLNASYLIESGLAQVVLSGEIEDELLALAQHVVADSLNAPAFGGDVPSYPAGAHGDLLSRLPASNGLPRLQRLDLPVPDRDGLPPPDRYARLHWQDEQRLAGSAESTRGCRHTCRHCPLTPIYGGRFFAVPVATVLADIRQQVASGVRHISFGDPDFLNGPTHALRIARAMHREFPMLTFDATIKVEHLIKHRSVVNELGQLGCIFVVSAVESLSDRVLLALDKGHTRADVMEALGVLDEAHIALRPSLLAFTPWTTISDYIEVIEWVIGEGLDEHVDPVHFAIRLLLPPGSSLLAALDASEWLGDLDAPNFAFQWRHPDPRMDRLHRDVTLLVENAARVGEAPHITVRAIRDSAYLTAGDASVLRPAITGRHRPSPPRMTESWFC